MKNNARAARRMTGCNMMGHMMGRITEFYETKSAFRASNLA
jgi:hypothetical protein